MKKLTEGQYYWVQPKKGEEWEIGKFKINVYASSKEPVFKFTNGSHMNINSVYDYDDREITR